MPYQSMSSRRGGSWTKVVIFISLYVMLFQSLIEWVVVVYLYAIKHVDFKMAPSLIFALVAAFFTVPLVVLHSFLSWQYNRIVGYESQKKVLHGVCTYILRLTILIWLGASVAGLVVVSQQAFCLPETATDGFWKAGISCALHRAVVIVSVLSFLTVCLYFCSRELCDRPYDVSLLGIYKPLSSREGSIVSESTLSSEKNLKRDIFCVCRNPDITYGRNPYTTSSDNSEASNFTPSIQQPSPIRPTSFLQFGADPVAEAEYLSGTTATPGTLRDQYFPGVSRTPSAATTHTTHQAQGQALPELPAGSGTPATTNHKRDKSSISSLRRFLPKSFPASQPLSADPQIRALAEESAHIDLEKQEVPQLPQEPTLQGQQSPPEPPAKSPQPPPKDNQPYPPSQPTRAMLTPCLPRSTTTNSADAPEVVTPAPLKIRRSSTTAAIPLSLNPNRASGSWATLLNPTQSRPMRMSTMRIPQRQSQFDPVYAPRYTQSQRFPSGRNRYSRHLRRNDFEPYQHSSLRRPRSSTFGNVSIVSVPGHLDCIRETGASLDELPPSFDRGAGAESTRG
ncbi:hypothetical protein BJX68DRAFT_129695 [Aspergillus pseudodeflectus]|uniref:Uncharacterized protein n=1 Tax=Aspergillus pseudodeflectus TaxID=176178 RepID=A0ABR4K084_9EURO